MQLSTALRAIAERSSFATEDDQRAALRAIDRCADQLDELDPGEPADDDEDQDDAPDAGASDEPATAPVKKTAPVKRAGTRRR